MGIKVTKFGGTSLADADQIRKVRAIVHSDRERRYVIPSAPGKRGPDDYKITDLLYLCHTNVQHGVSFDHVFQIISERYLSIAGDLDLSTDLQPVLERIRTEIAGGAPADYVASRGEYLSGRILADYLGYDFIDPAELIHFDAYGSYDAEQTGRDVRRCLAPHETAVIPGFYGSTPDGKVKTFSRGGSDITGAIVAHGVGADLYENWTDVSGFYMADPRVVKDPKLIKRVTYRELRELSYMGASVLHEESIFPVKKAGIPILIKNTNRPEDPGTFIVNDDEPLNKPGQITGIAGRKDFTIIAIEKALMNSELGFARKILSILETNRISFEHLPSGIDTISVVIADDQLNNKMATVLKEIERECKPDSLEVIHDMALIATVGRGMAYTPGIAAKLFTSLGKAGVNVRMIDQGASEINIIVGVETADFEQAVQAIYNAFVE